MDFTHQADTLQTENGSIGSTPKRSADGIPALNNIIAPEETGLNMGQPIDCLVSHKVADTDPERQSRTRKHVICDGGKYTKVAPKDPSKHPYFHSEQLLFDFTSPEQLSGILKQLVDRKEPRIITYGRTIEGVNSPYRRTNENLALPNGTRRLLIDADGWHIPDGFNPNDKISIAVAVRKHLTESGLEYLAKGGLTYLMSGGCLPDEDGIFRKLNAHLYFYLDQPITLDDLRRWGLAVNLRCGSKIIDPAVFRTAQPDYFLPPIIEGGPDPILNRIGWIPPVNQHTDLFIAKARIDEETKSITHDLPAATSRGISNVSSLNGTKGENWSETIQRFGTSGHCHEPAIKAAGQMVFELGTDYVEANLGKATDDLHQEAWNSYKVVEGRNRKADESQYGRQYFQQCLSSALGRGFGLPHDVARQSILDIQDGPTLMGSRAISIMQQVRRTPLWRTLSTELNEHYRSKKLLTKLDRTVKDHQARNGVKNGTPRTPEYVLQYKTLIEAGFRFLVSVQGAVFVRCPNHDGVVSGTDKNVFYRLANRAMIAANIDHAIITDTSIDKLLSYVAGSASENVECAIRTFREENSRLTWVDSGVGDRVFKIGADKVDILEGDEASACPALFIRELQAPFPTITQEQIDQQIRYAELCWPENDSSFSAWGANRRFFLDGWDLTELEMQTLFAFMVYCLLAPGEYPILHLIGKSNAGKSFLAACIIWGYEPRYGDTQGPGRWNHNFIVGGLPKDNESLALQARSQYTSCADNLNSQEGLSNKQTLSHLTTLATGASFTARRLYSQTDTVRFTCVAPQIITGIDELVNIPQDHQDLLTRIYPINVRARSTTRRQKFYSVMQDESSRTSRFLEVLAAASYVQANLGDHMHSRHRITAFGEIMGLLFPGSDNQWMEEHFSMLERRSFEVSTDWFKSFHDVLIRQRLSVWEGSAMEIARIAKLTTPASRIGRCLSAECQTIERLYGWKITYDRQAEKRIWRFEIPLVPECMT